MTDQVTQYRRRVRRCLRCNAVTKIRLLNKLDKLLNSYIEEHDHFSAEALTDAFGSPDDMAKNLIESVTPEEMEQFHKHNKLKQVILCFILVIFMFFTIWLYFYKEVGLTSISDINIGDEFAVPTLCTDPGDVMP